MRRTILHILSTSYSGSSLLTLLLDCQLGVRGLGDAVHLAERSQSAECLRCGVPAKDCQLARVVSDDAFYGPILDYYGSPTTVLVDASKSLWNSLLRHPSEPDLDHLCILLSKSPHEFAASWVGHHFEASVDDAFRLYLAFYRAELEFLWNVYGVAPDCVTTVTYQDLARQPHVVLQSLCNFVHIVARPLVDCRWWESDSHVIGGNWLVNAQVTGFDETLQRAGPQDRVRYAGREHAVFYDPHWESDREFVQECLVAYDQWKSPLTPILRELGQPAVERLYQEAFLVSRSPPIEQSREL
jgi:hypothetical protein